MAGDPSALFTVDPLDRNAANHHGSITSAAAANNVILLGTSNARLVRHDFNVGGDPQVLDLSGGLGGDHPVHRVFLDPGGRRCIATVLHPKGPETYYTHAGWPRPRERPLARLKGLVVNAVAWNHHEIMIGTVDGQMFEMAVNEANNPPKYAKLLFELGEAITGLQMETTTVLSATRYYVMAVTPTRLYSFIGVGSLQAMFTKYSDHADHFMELPGEIPNSELHFFTKQRRVKHFAWLSGSGVYYGNLNFCSSGNGDESFVENKRLLGYSKLGEDCEVIKPRSLGVSEFHFLLLVGKKVKIVNRVSQQIVEELTFDHGPEPVSRGIIGFCGDATTGLFYAYDQSSIYQVSVHDEGRDMWRVYLDVKEFTSALAHCHTSLQREQVYLAQADAAFSLKVFYSAASFYAKVNYSLSIEEVCLKFIAIGEQDALRTFLLRKLDDLTEDDKCHMTMISTWATELYLDKINSLLLVDDTSKVGHASSENNSLEYHSLIIEFRAFLGDCKDMLDETTTMLLLENSGRVDELVYFAGLKEHYEIVVHHYIQLGEAKKALEILEKPNVSIDLQYKFAPDLITLDADETVESWISSKKLNPRKLIPALMRYENDLHAKTEVHQGIRYLRNCIKLGNEDPGVHNLLILLYAKQGDDERLVPFLQGNIGKGSTSSPEFFYEPKYALQVCLKEKRMLACVHIYSRMGMHEEAVALALLIDPYIAMHESSKVEDDKDLRRKLCLMIAKHVIEQEKGVKRENILKVIAFLKEIDGLLKIEDILPFFPDFALIDDFKEVISSSLKDYNKRIEQLKQEMDDATQRANNIRSDITALSQRCIVIKRDEECGVCKCKVLTGGVYGRSNMPVGSMAPFYVFPCSHAFHAQCLIAHIIQHTSQAQAGHILELQKQLTLLEDSQNPSGRGKDDIILSSIHEEKLRLQLDNAIASECPFCGDLIIREISLPFFKPEEAEQMASWEKASYCNSKNSTYDGTTEVNYANQSSHVSCYDTIQIVAYS